MMFELAGQKVLITGDAGCVDFWDRKAKRYHPALISALNDLHVAQVAYHAGNNHRFYEVLENSAFAGGSGPESYLLLSHADHDTYRPSAAFDAFVAKLSANQATFELLTTSQPDPAKVTAYRTHYHPPTQSPAKSVGDVRLSYQNSTWTGDQHLVKV